jgi:hypothetical protein
MSELTHEDWVAKGNELAEEWTTGARSHEEIFESLSRWIKTCPSKNRSLKGINIPPDMFEYVRAKGREKRLEEEAKKEEDLERIGFGEREEGQTPDQRARHVAKAAALVSLEALFYAKEILINELGDVDGMKYARSLLMPSIGNLSEVVNRPDSLQRGIEIEYNDSGLVVYFKLRPVIAHEWTQKYGRQYNDRDKALGEIDKFLYKMTDDEAWDRVNGKDDY